MQTPLRLSRLIRLISKDLQPDDFAERIRTLDGTVVWGFSCFSQLVPIRCDHGGT